MSVIVNWCRFLLFVRLPSTAQFSGDWVHEQSSIPADYVLKPASAYSWPRSSPESCWTSPFSRFFYPQRASSQETPEFIGALNEILSLFSKRRPSACAECSRRERSGLKWSLGLRWGLREEVPWRLKKTFGSSVVWGWLQPVDRKVI